MISTQAAPNAGLLSPSSPDMSGASASAKAAASAEAMGSSSTTTTSNINSSASPATLADLNADVRSQGQLKASSRRVLAATRELSPWLHQDHGQYQAVCDAYAASGGRGSMFQSNTARAAQLQIKLLQSGPGRAAAAAVAAEAAAAAARQAERQRKQQEAANNPDLQYCSKCKTPHPLDDFPFKNGVRMKTCSASQEREMESKKVERQRKRQVKRQRKQQEAANNPDLQYCSKCKTPHPLDYFPFKNGVRMKTCSASQERQRESQKVERQRKQQEAANNPDLQYCSDCKTPHPLDYLPFKNGVRLKTCGARRKRQKRERESEQVKRQRKQQEAANNPDLQYCSDCKTPHPLDYFPFKNGVRLKTCGARLKRRKLGTDG